MSIPALPDRRAARWMPLVLACAGATVAAQGLDVARERERIVRERAQVEAVARERQAECTRLFVVSTCAEGVRRERSEQLRQLDRRRAVLDASVRKQRASERQAALATRREAEAASAPPLQLRQRAPRAGESEARPVRRAGIDDAERAHARARAASSADSEAAMRARAAAARASEAEAHRAQVEQRNRDRAAKRKPALPLPLPLPLPAAAAPSAAAR